MPIKNFVTGDVPYLEKYEPFQLNGIEVVSVADMISYDLTPRFTPTTIDYTLGSEDLYIKTLNIRNITANADILISLKYSKNFFHITSDYKLPIKDVDANTKEIQTVIRSDQTIKFDIVLNNSLIDAGVFRNVVSANIEVTVTNLQNGQIIRRSPNAVLYQQTSFPLRVTIQ